MTSKSRAAQEQLALLEKQAAPFEDQLVEAAKFIGLGLHTVCESAGDGIDGEEGECAILYHGREEWLLRWLLKRLQAPSDEIPRSTPSSWRILCHLLRKIPLPNAARILVERQFLSIIRRSLEEAQKIAKLAMVPRSNSESSATEQETVKASKKRRRSGELVTRTSTSESTRLSSLLDAIFSAVNCVVQNTKATSLTLDRERSSAFSAEYMKTVIRTTAEEASTTLGLWLSLCHTALPQVGGLASVESWLSPFIEVWNSHITVDAPHLQFSLHTTRPLLNLLRSSKDNNFPSSWTQQSEILVASNIVIPAKADQTLLETLTKASVLQNVGNAPLLFDIAIRAVQPTGSARRRKAPDEKFLQSVFGSLKASMSNVKGDNGKQICEMLQLAINHKLDLDLAILRNIFSERAVADWDILATLIELDANVFLLDEGTVLLHQLLEAITKASLSLSWSDIQEMVVSTVLVPLMREFAKARDLSGFIRYWFTQLIAYETLRENADMALFSAWEDEALQIELQKLMEPSLNVSQIIKILDWLAEEVSEHPDAVCVILEVIAGSISGEEQVVDAVNSRLYHIMFDDNAADKLNPRYRWRSWRIISHTLTWIEMGDLSKLGALWEDKASPFDSLSGLSKSGSILKIKPKDKRGLESLEIFRFACAAWTAATKRRRSVDSLQSLDKPTILGFLRGLAKDISQFITDLQENKDLGDEICGLKQNSLQRGKGWLIWALVRCLFVEHQDVLVIFLASEVKIFSEILEHIFLIASVTCSANESTVSSSWLEKNPKAFQDIWRLALRGGASTLRSDIPDSINNPIFTHSGLTKIFVNIILSHETNLTNPFLKTPGNNAFAIRSLNDLTVDEIPKEYRGRIMSSWLPTDKAAESKDGLSYGSTVLNNGVLFLKRKIMRRPKLYEGMKFQELIDFADTLAEAELPSRFDNLASLKDLARLTFVSALQAVDQPRSSTYLSDAFKKIQRKANKAIEKKKHKMNFAVITMFEVALSAFHQKAAALHDLNIVRKDDLDSVTASFKDCILSQFKDLLPNLQKENANDTLLVLSIIGALSTLGVDNSRLTGLEDVAAALVVSAGKTSNHFGERLQTFMVIHGPKADDSTFATQLSGSVTDVYSRESVIARTKAVTSKMSNDEKLELLQELLGEDLDGLTQLDTLLATRQVIISIEDTRKPKKETRPLDDSDDEVEEEAFDLTEAYNILALYLRQCTDVVQFNIISETLMLMLETKRHNISQYNIDATLGSITILCSPDSPNLHPVYMHLCWLMQSVLTHQRLKLKGHSHLTQQTLQSLLRCLFIPLPHSNTKNSKLGLPPPWLLPNSHQLTAIHAEAFTKLVLSICDPTVSAVQGNSNTLTSEKDKAKRIAAQYMKFVLQDYVRGQLEMKMLPEVREKMIPGLYAILNCFTEEIRDAVSAELDSSGRAVFMRLYADWRKFEKPRGY
ncbi:Urb2/Npa2 family-domain-containing protein [Rhexocercosporidium sp. MPI-PUGE-AT-0058]|nr:Urb2/Npa2 family-domain-containing protein [Rhexocercosporidium sp. MPI-PUGE-AT-0058]